ncbi:MAG: response regulator transcription factor [Acidobacteria bacterium]|nr:response regulator transcription factor [Acidobacteriota bacterium]
MENVRPPYRIVIADDHPIFRDGLRRLLELDAAFVVVGEAADGAEALKLVKQLGPDMLLLDLAMPRVPGLETLAELAKAKTPVRTILLTAQIERAQIVEALQLGARGIVLKESATELLMESIRVVMAGQYWVGRESVSDLVATLRELMPRGGEEPSTRRYGLTPREMEVISAIVAGYTNKDIAQKFAISEQTVKHHLTNVFDKVGVSTRLELALFAVNHHLTDGII